MVSRSRERHGALGKPAIKTKAILKKKKGKEKHQKQQHIASCRGDTSGILRRKKQQQKTKDKEERAKKQHVAPIRSQSGVQWQTPSYQAKWLTAQLDSGLGSSLSQLEHIQPLPEQSFVTLLQEGREPSKVRTHLKTIFGEGWEDALCKSKGEKEKGSPSVLIVCSSAVRCTELLKGLRSLTKECKPAKLFAKHIKLEEQVKALEKTVNLAVGTPNRVKKLIDIGALGLGSLALVLVDMQEDAKGFTIFSVPQVKTDLLELCKAHLHQLAVDGQLKFCLY